MMSLVTIKGLKLKARIGIEKRELVSAQEVVLDISFQYDDRLAGRTDDIAKAVDYKAMVGRISVLLKCSRFNLLEKMAREVLKVVMADKRVKKASVTVTKPRAIPRAAGVSLTVTAP